MNDKTVVLNGAKMNYDGQLDFSVLSSDVTVYDDTARDQVLERIAGADIIVTKEMPVRADLLAAFPDSVKLICEAGTGFNNIDLAAAKARGITVCNIPAYSTERVAHTAIMLMLMLASTMRVQMSRLAEGDRSNFTEYLHESHTELNGKTLGIIGLGNIGHKVAKIAQALDMNVLAYSRTPKDDGLRYVPLDELLSSSDYVTLHCALSDDTRHIINAGTIAKMKDGAYIVNTSRGPLIDEPALIEALRSGKLAGAGLDVQETEPPAQDNPLYDMENVVLTPHMGWKGLETRKRLVSILAGNISSYLAGTPVNVVNK